jgi:hypothetical protein
MDGKISYALEGIEIEVIDGFTVLEKYPFEMMVYLPTN